MLAEHLELQPHPLCSMFPDMSKTTYEKLLESVVEHGAQKPVVTLDGLILDGRHRHRAYVEANVDFEVVEWSGQYGSPLNYVIAENEVRRDLNKSQRATLASDIKKQRYLEKSQKLTTERFKRPLFRTVPESRSTRRARPPSWVSIVLMCSTPRRWKRRTRRRSGCQTVM